MGRWTAAVAGLACVLAGCRGGPLEAERLQAWVQRPWGAGRGVVSNEKAVFLHFLSHKNYNYVGEVDALAAQLHFRNHRFRKAKRLAASALRKLYAMGATWDKRLSYEAWVGFCRLLVVRSEAEVPSWMAHSSLPETALSLRAKRSLPPRG